MLLFITPMALQIVIGGDSQPLVGLRLTTSAPPWTRTCDSRSRGVPTPPQFLLFVCMALFLGLAVLPTWRAFLDTCLESLGRQACLHAMPHMRSITAPDLRSHCCGTTHAHTWAPARLPSQLTSRLTAAHPTPLSLPFGRGMRSDLAAHSIPPHRFARYSPLRLNPPHTTQRHTCPRLA